MAEKKMYPIHL